MSIVDTLKTVVGMDPTRNADPDMRRVLDELKSLHPKAIEDLSPAEARRQPTIADAVVKLLTQDLGDALEPMDVQTHDIAIPGADGSNPARVYTPLSALEPGAARGLVLYFHGGGFVIADIDTYDATPRAIAAQTGAIVVSAHYRQAPEQHFPAAHLDAFAAYEWLLENGASLGGDPALIAVLGESAGGNLAANVSIHARDTGLQAPVHQALIYPLANTDPSTTSYGENSNAKPLNKPMMLWFLKHTLADPADKDNLMLKLIDADLSGLPTTTVITAGIDPLRSEGEQLVDRLRASGVTVLHRNYPGATHEFFGTAAVVSAAREAQAVVSEDLRHAFTVASQSHSAAAPMR